MSHLVHKEELSWRTAAQAPMESVSMSHLVCKEEPSWRTAVSATSPMTLTILDQSLSSDQGKRHYPPATPMKGKSVSFEWSPPTPTLITAKSPSESWHYNVLTPLPFGTETEAVLEELGYPDHFHQVCISISKDYLLKWWIMKLQELAEILEEHMEAIGNAMLTDSQPVTSFTVRITVMVLPAKCLDEDQEIWAVLNYIHVKATELALKFKQPQCRYLEQLSLGSIIHHCKHNKTSAWHAYMHFKGIKNNANKSFSEKLNIANLIKEKTEYHCLTTEEKEQLIIDFDKVKKSSQDHPPNITTKSCAAECSQSFQFMREELKALKECVGAEAFIVMDIAQMATDFESTILANGLIMNTAANHRQHVANAKTVIQNGLHASLCKVTNCSSAIMEFKCYNDLVQHYHVKLIGWNHPYWANPSDLKGRIKSLNNVVLVVQANTYLCGFVRALCAPLLIHR
ncbi:uncharacterized protein BJ212DRAFT_1302795 [Suillus subaureus]|uniref:Uncharacterized protein n=1 Tax=Suillus subaureus TaxID=48587 RepID=A0A9P7E1J4_9AGAM|nr:uncharacterized protein BJ212DRAFT_1302795 [Suillus subaureus]KAG1808895.1 hypothetical protein BJ212DRAFT_1302795 [Suillus subaureus]